MNNLPVMKSSLLVVISLILVGSGSYAVGAQGFTDQHEQEHLRREAEAYTNGLKDGSLEDGLGEIDRIYLSQIKNPQERSKIAAEIRKKNLSQALARLEKSREIIQNTVYVFQTPDGELMTPKTIHGPGPLSN